MLETLKYKMCTVPYLVETRKNTKFRCRTMNINKTNLILTILNSEVQQHLLFAFKDVDQNILLVDAINIYLINKNSNTSLRMDRFFTVYRKADENEIDLLIKSHSRILSR